MGIAMITIMLFHNHFGIFGKAGDIFSYYGHWGVDVFVFLSGFGLFFALNKSGKKSSGNFYIRRAVRILPAALFAGWGLFLLGKADSMGLFGLNLWYIRTILILYLTAPVVYRLINRFSPYKVMLGLTLLSVVILLVSIPYLSMASWITQTSILWTLARFPAFVLGMMIAYVNWDVKKLVNIPCISACLVILGILFYLHYVRAIEESLSSYLHLLPYILLAFIIPSVCLIISKLSQYTPRFIRKGIEFFGIYSLEIYLVHEAIFAHIARYPYPACLKFAIGYSLSIIAALLLHLSVVIFWKVVNIAKNRLCAKRTAAS